MFSLFSYMSPFITDAYKFYLLPSRFFEFIIGALVAFLGSVLELEIGLNSYKEGLTIYHQNCIINYEARIGKNAKFHGLNCVGNTEEGVPTIGDNVEFGVGASVIGNVSIADNVKIGAGAVVTKSVLEVGAVIAGIPAKKIK